jgi:hypothetical protein
VSLVEVGSHAPPSLWKTTSEDEHCVSESISARVSNK